MEKTKGNKKIENKLWETKNLMNRPAEKDSKVRNEWI